jgi:hypothetical protein
MSDISNISGQLFHTVQKQNSQSIENVSLEIDKKTTIRNENDKFAEYRDQPAIPAVP